MARRGQNEGTIFEEKPGKWRASVSAGRRNGKRIRKTFTGSTRKEVQEKLTRALMDQQNGINVAPQRQSVAQFLTGWLENVAKPRVRSSTYGSYKWIIEQHIIPNIGKIPLQKLSPERVQRFLNDVVRVGDPGGQTPEPLKPRTVQHIHATLRAALAKAEKWGTVSRNVATLVDAPRVPHRQMKLFSPEQARSFLASLADDRLEALYSVAIALGLRQGEALGLRWADIDLAGGRLSVNNALQRVDGKLRLVETKRDRSRRTINLPQVCVSALWKHRARQEEERRAADERWKDTGFVFTTGVGTPLDGPTVTHRFQGALKKANLPHMRFHDLRHTCATLLLAQGVHPRLVMEILGHSTIAITMNTYSHVIPAMQKDVADRMDEILKVATSVATSPDKPRDPTKIQ